VQKTIGIAAAYDASEDQEHLDIYDLEASEHTHSRSHARATHEESIAEDGYTNQSYTWSRHSAISMQSVATAASAASSSSMQPGQGPRTNQQTDPNTPPMIPLDPNVEYDVTLLVDKRERANALILGNLISARISWELASLSVGDFLWVAVPRKKASSAIAVETANSSGNGKKGKKGSANNSASASAGSSGESVATSTNTAAVTPGVDKDSILQGIEHEVLILDCIAERKSIPDLVSSLVDGRYTDQKFRLKTTGIKSCLYLVEGEHLVVPMQQKAITPQHIKTAMTVTFVEHDMHIIRTRGMDHSTQMLQYIHRLVLQLTHASFF
jgi:ERCC4-type nuclease